MRKAHLRAGAGSGVALIAAVILFYRFPERFLNGFLWAEDVQEFLEGAYTKGLTTSVKWPYAGYLHVLPRALVWLVARYTPIQEIPFVLPMVCLVLSALAAAAIYLCALQVPWRSGHVKWAAAVALTPFLIPHSGEVFVTLTNIQWILGPVLIGLLFTAPHARGISAVAIAVAVLLLALTGPFGALLSPFVALVVGVRWRSRPSHWTGLIAGSYALGVLIQVSVMLGNQVNQTYGDVALLDSTVNELFAPAVLPAALLKLSDGFAPAGVFVLIVSLVTALATSRIRMEVLVMLGFAVTLWIAARLKVSGDYILNWNGAGARYTFIPYVLLAWSLLFAAGTTAKAGAAYAPMGALALMLLVSGSSFTEKGLEATKVEKVPGGWHVMHPPAWKHTLRDGRLKILEPVEAYPSSL